MQANQNKQYFVLGTVVTAVVPVLIGTLCLFLPSQVFDLDPIDGLINEAIKWIPKFGSDAQRINSFVGQGWGFRYVLSGILAIGSFFTLVAYVILRSKSEITAGNYCPSSKVFVKMLLGNAIIIFALWFLLQDTWMASSDARAAKAIFRTYFCVFWLPALAIVLVDAFQNVWWASIEFWRQ